MLGRGKHLVSSDRLLCVHRSHGYSRGDSVLFSKWVLLSL